MGGLVLPPRISHSLATDHLARQGSMSIQCWSLQNTHSFRSLPDHGVRIHERRHKLQLGTNVSGLPEELLLQGPGDKACLYHLCHSPPFVAFISVLTLLIHWIGASRCTEYAAP
ncbi:unnamed protein product [Penicillium camemberti]|uniref:Str. FM013 n=1 Tax=Penicillium camemberti (strain FM 013) TaxID=1429867 RepID=A0A0G4P1E1_PENC3|nr:unnamed protein product [Penicillium camemberti]